MPLCRIKGEMHRLSNRFRVGPLREKTLWLGSYGRLRSEFGSLRSNRVIELIYGERTKQFARVRPTGPHPAIIT